MTVHYAPDIKITGGIRFDNVKTESVLAPVEVYIFVLDCDLCLDSFYS